MLRGEQLLKFESVQNWFKSLDQMAKNRGTKGLSKAAKAMRLGRMWEFTNKGELNPDELLTEAQENIDKAGQRLADYFEIKSKQVSWNSTITSFCYLRGFYTHNGLTFPKKWGVPKKKVSKVSKEDAKNSFFEYNEKNDEIEFQNGNMQHFIGNLNFRDQTIALCLLSSGADATDLFKLNVGFVKDGRGKIVDKKRIFWNGNRAKTGEPFKTFFSEEATQFLKHYVEQERANAKDEEPLFVGQSREYNVKSGPHAGKKVVVDERLTTHSLSSNFREAAQKIGYAKEKNVASPFRPKRFRHLFRTACAIAQIDEGYVMAMMGHASNISASYLEQSSGIFEKMYVKVEPLLTVFGVNQSVVNGMTKEIQNLKGHVDVLSKAGKIVSNKTEELEVKIETLQNKLEKTQQLAESWEKFFFKHYDPLLKFVQELSRLPEFAKLKQKALEAKGKRIREDYYKELSQK